jgi:glycosyltransferase involved in cell wall biosynthesis
VFGQSFQDFEVILLDDASTDGSQELLKTYSNHPKVSHIVLNETNSGSPFRQWTKGITLTKGVFIWIAESDDYSDKQFLEETVKVLNVDEQLGMVFTDTIKVDEHEMPLGLASDNSIFNELKAHNNIINRYNLSTFLIKNLVILNVSSVLFRREALLKLDFSTLVTFKNTGDRFTYLSIAFEHHIKYIDVPLNYLRLHTLNTTKLNIKSGIIYRDRLMVLNYFLKELISIKSKPADLKYYFKELYLPCVDFKYHKEIRKTLKTFYRYKLLNFNEFIVLYGYSILPLEFQFIRTNIKEFIKKL